MPTRVKSGCITCRIRRVKCDEGKPQCERCIASKRVCDGYLTSEDNMPRRQLAIAARNLSRIGPVSRALSRSPASASIHTRLLYPEDATYFDLFRSGTIPSSTSLFPSTFWEQIVLQVAERESAVWHAIIALGILHKCTDTMSISNGDRDQLMTHADKYYGKAVSLSSELDSDSKRATLSTVLVAAANLLGRWSEAKEHILVSLNIMSKDSGQTPTLKPLQGTLPRTELQVMTFHESTSPYPFEQSTNTMPPQVALEETAVQPTCYEDLASEFFDIARTYYLIDELFTERSITYGPWLTNTDGLLRRLAAWEEQVIRFETSSPPGPQAYLTKLSLRMFHATLRLMLKATPFGPETRFDAHLGICEYIFRLAATITGSLSQSDNERTCISFEPGVVLPLWIVTHRCRHPRLRHASLEVLSNLHRTEGMWNSDLAASIMTAVVAIEEEHFEGAPLDPYIPVPVDPSATGIPMTAWKAPTFDIVASVGWDGIPLVPEERRVKDILGTQDFRRRLMKLIFLTAPTGDAKGYGSVRQVEVSFASE